MQKTQETQAWSLDWEDSLEEGMATHSGILVWRIPWTEEPGRLQPIGSQRVRHEWSDLTCKRNISNNKRHEQLSILKKLLKIQNIESGNFISIITINCSYHFLSTHNMLKVLTSVISSTQHLYEASIIVYMGEMRLKETKGLVSTRTKPQTKV